MAWIKPKRGERVVRRKQADGSIKVYRYPAYKAKTRSNEGTVEALIDAYRSSPEWAALAAGTKEHRTTYLKPLADLGHVAIKDVKRRDIIAIHDGMRTKRGDGAANGFLVAARGIFAWAIDKEWIEHLPTLRIRSAPEGHWRAWTRQEADAAEAGLPEQLRRVVVLARHTGQRRGDLCALTWANYDGNLIHVTQQKTKPGAEPVRLTIPAAPALRVELDRWKASATALTILTNARGRPWNAQTLSHSLPFALAKIGLPSDLGVHGLRKLAATELANAGCSPHEIAAVTGHRTLGMVELYTRSVDQERLAGAAVLRLADYKPRK